MNKPSLLAFILVLLLPFFTFADSEQCTDKQQAARNFVQQVSTQALDIVSNNQSENTALEKLEALFSSTVDIDWIAKFVLGQYYKNYTPAEISQFQKSYREYILKKYIPKFKAYTSHAFTVTGSRDLGENYYVISSSVNDPEKAKPLNVEYRVRQLECGKLQIRDISVEGISLILTQRSDFTDFLHNNSMKELIQKLDDRSFAIKQ